MSPRAPATPLAVLALLLAAPLAAALPALPVAPALPDVPGLAEAEAGDLLGAAAAAVADRAAHLPAPAAQAQRDLAVARDLLALDGAADVVARAHAWQAESLGFAIVVPAPSDGDVPGLVAAIAARHGVTLDPAQAGAAQSLAGHAPVARLLAAYLALAEATDAAFAGATLTGTWPAPPGPAMPAWDAAPGAMPQAVPGRDFGAAFAARQAFLAAALDLQGALAAQPRAAAPLDVAGVLSIDLGAADNVYAAHYALQVDAGGNDQYRNNAGGSNLDDGVCNDPLSAGTAGAGALVDLAGNDRYEDAASPCPWGMNGGAYLGTGFLYDAAGDDTYRGGLIVNGGGYDGAGFLLDAGGNDAYYAWGYVNQGSASQGSGMLLDLGAGADRYTNLQGWGNGGAYQGAAFLLDGGGNDRYLNVGSFGNGGGGYQGAGFLLDLGGDDVYTEHGGASNGGAAFEGTGFLLDAAGNDQYLAPTFSGSGSNGAAFSLAVGMLLDLGGNDLYDAKCGAANGGGVFLGAGFLLDAGGDDRYLTVQGASNGGGAQGSGFLLDAGGNDLYRGGVVAVNGGATDGGRGSLVDLGGNDAYTAVAIGVNGGTAQSPYFVPGSCYYPTQVICMSLPISLGLLLDLGGADRYADSDGGSGADKTVVPKGSLGVQVDVGL